MEAFFQDWVLGLLTLTALEIVLGIDNIVLISIAVDRLPEAQRKRAGQLGLGLALLLRIVFLFFVSWIVGLTEPVFEVFSKAISWRDIILMSGGLFLLYKACNEIYDFVEFKGDHGKSIGGKSASFGSVIGQIVIFDLIFSFDSVLTAVGLTDKFYVMVTAVVISILFMMIFVDKVTEFVRNNPSVKILALSFLVLVGVLLMAEGGGSHLDRGYVYFAMAFSLSIELLNKRRRRKQSYLGF